MFAMLLSQINVLENFSANLLLVADTQLYKRLCLSVGPSVHPSVRRSVMIESKRGKTSVLDTLCVCLCVGRRLGCGWGLDAPAHLSATILWPCITCSFQDWILFPFFLLILVFPSNYAIAFMSFKENVLALLLVWILMLMLAINSFPSCIGYPFSNFIFLLD